MKRICSRAETRRKGGGNEEGGRGVTGTIAPISIFNVWCEEWHNERYEKCCLTTCRLGKVGNRG